MTYVKAFIAATLGAVVMWLTAGIWHEILASHIYADRIADQHQGVGVIFISYLVLAVIMTFFLRHTRVSEIPLVHGAILGMVIGVLWVFPHELSLAAAHGEPLGYVFGNALWHVIEQGIGGVVIATSMRGLEKLRLGPA